MGNDVASKGTQFENWVKGLVEPRLTDNSTTVLEKRYLRRDKDNITEESAKDMFARIAWHISGSRESFANKLYSVMITGEFMFNSPTLFNAGTGNGLGLSACYIRVPEDNLESIMQVNTDLALIQKAGGGVGYDFSLLRPKGTMVKTCGATTDGPLPFIDMYCWTTNAIQQGAKRRGAQMGMLRIDHPDVWDFIHAKEDLSRWQNMNISLKVTNEWMDCVIDDPDQHHVVQHPKWGTGPGILVRNKTTGEVKSYPNNQPTSALSNYTVITVGDVFDAIVKRAWTTGEPGLAFWDRVEDDWAFPVTKRYPMRTTNPCGEVPGEDGMSCNLGSINLATCVIDGKWDQEKFEELVRLGVRALDNAVSVNEFPVETITKNNKATRRIGLGVMGWADLLFILGKPYSSQDARDMAKSISLCLGKISREESIEIALVDGPYPAWLEQDGKPAQRNVYTNMLAPTGTISIIANCSCGIEPIFSLVIYRKVMKDSDGTTTNMVEVNPHFQRALEDLASTMIGGDKDAAIHEAVDYVAENGTVRGFSGRLSTHSGWGNIIEVFETARDVSMDGHVLMQAAWQTSVDQAISKTINLPEDASLDQVKKAYLLAYENGCKGITVYRDNCRNGIEGQVQPMQLAPAKTENIGPSDLAKSLQSAFEKEMKRLDPAPSDVEIHNEHEVLDIQLQDELQKPDTIPEIMPKNFSFPPKELPDIMEAIKIKQRTLMGNMHVMLVHEEGVPVELFAHLSKAGEQETADLEAICRLVSLCLRQDTSIDDILRQIEHIGTSNAVFSADGPIKSIPDALAMAIKKGLKKLDKTEGKVKTLSTRNRTKFYRERCPECSSELKFESGCASCSNQCGYSRC
jgi:ribonucleoside-diphosphate reductase alpha chain